jgi:hypothetical protein
MAEEGNRMGGLAQTSNSNIKGEQLNAVNSLTTPPGPAGSSGPDSIFTPISAVAAGNSPQASSTISQQIQQEQVDASPMSTQLNKMLKRNKKDTEKKFLLNDEDFN